MNHKYIAAFIIAFICVMFLVCIVLLATPAAAAEPVRTAKQIALHDAAECLRAAGYAEDSEVIRTLQEEWRREQENLDIVARVVMGEAGACPFEHMIAVAAVVVNRVHSPLFPSSVRDVVAQQGQYTTAYLTGFERTNRASYEAAKIALDGTDDVPDDVVWQAEFRQGTEVWWESVVDTGWYRSTTYFCR